MVVSTSRFKEKHPQYREVILRDTSIEQTAPAREVQLRGTE